MGTVTAGKTQSEGGFAPDRVAAVALLNTAIVEDKKGKKYYEYEFLSRAGTSLFRAREPPLGYVACLGVQC